MAAALPAEAPKPAASKPQTPPHSPRSSTDQLTRHLANDSSLQTKRTLRSRLADSLHFQYTLENKGSVARDHLANERTYLAWLRTSISLASIGIAVTQLFRISAAAVNDPARRRRRALDPALTVMGQATDFSAMYAESPSDPLLVALYEQQRLQASQIDDLLAVVAMMDDRKNYFLRLGRPVGSTFIILSLLFLWLGAARFFSVQRHLTIGQFTPARRSVLAASLAVVGVIIAAFAAVLIAQ